MIGWLVAHQLAFELLVCAQTLLVLSAMLILRLSRSVLPYIYGTTMVTYCEGAYGVPTLLVHGEDNQRAVARFVQRMHELCAIAANDAVRDALIEREMYDNLDDYLKHAY